MRKLFFIILSVTIFIFNGFAQKTENTHNVIIYYFHATNRCPTCLAIEKEIRGVLNNSYLEKLNNGKIKLITYNFEEKENLEMVKKYDAYGSTVMIVKTGKVEKKEDFTGLAFQYVLNKPEMFRSELKKVIDELLK